MEVIKIQNKEFEIGKLKGKHLRLISKTNKEDSLKFIEIVLGVDEAFVDEMDTDEISLVSEAVERQNPSIKTDKNKKGAE